MYATNLSSRFIRTFFIFPVVLLVSGLYGCGAEIERSPALVEQHFKEPLLSYERRYSPNYNSSDTDDSIKNSNFEFWNLTKNSSDQKVVEHYRMNANNGDIKSSPELTISDIDNTSHVTFIKADEFFWYAKSDVSDNAIMLSIYSYHPDSGVKHHVSLPSNPKAIAVLLNGIEEKEHNAVLESLAESIRPDIGFGNNNQLRVTLNYPDSVYLMDTNRSIPLTGNFDETFLYSQHGELLASHQGAYSHIQDDYWFGVTPIKNKQSDTHAYLHILNTRDDTNVKIAIKAAIKVGDVNRSWRVYDESVLIKDGDYKSRVIEAYNFSGESLGRITLPDPKRYEFTDLGLLSLYSEGDLENNEIRMTVLQIDQYLKEHSFAKFKTPLESKFTSETQKITFAHFFNQENGGVVVQYVLEGLVSKQQESTAQNIAQNIEQSIEQNTTEVEQRLFSQSRFRYLQANGVVSDVVKARPTIFKRNYCAYESCPIKIVEKGLHDTHTVKVDKNHLRVLGLMFEDPKTAINDAVYFDYRLPTMKN